MRYPIVPDDDSEFTISNALRDLDGLVKADKVYIDYDPKNKYFLFQLGMMLAFNQYQEAARVQDKEYRLLRPIMPTPDKSYGNVILSTIVGNISREPDYIINLGSAFLISPVRVAGEYAVARGRAEKKRLLESHNDIHYPYDDTDQDDKNGSRIVHDNLDAESRSSTVYMIYDNNSTGSVVDVGSYFMLKYFLDKKTNQQYGRSFELLDTLNGENRYEMFLKELER